MNKQTINLLNEFNRKFYDQFAQSFADSRTPSEPGLMRVLHSLPPDARVLDLGCGQGRIALLAPPTCTYVGLDFSQSMVDIARAATQHYNTQAEFQVGDLLADQWPLHEDVCFDWIILRAVLHHIPGIQNRRHIVRHARQYLAPEGKIVLANWQFMDSSRLQRRILKWDTIGLSPTAVEENDYLLDWQRDGYGLRYVHLVDEAETHDLAVNAALKVTTLFRADGHHNNMTLYTVLEAEN